MKILVTGAKGFIGSNLCLQLSQNPDYEILPFDQNNQESDLAELVSQADFIFHLAGINRPKDEAEFETGNYGFTNTLLKYMESSKRNIPIVITSSIQAELDNAYGKSKKAAEEAVISFGTKTHAKVYIYRLPNVFGKWCRPNYNSVVATFCNNIANDQPIQINDPATKLSLVYIDDVVNEFIRTLTGSTKRTSTGYYEIERIHNTTLGNLAEKLYKFKDIHTSLMIPDFSDSFDRALYATFLTYFDKELLGYNMDIKSDERGWLFEFLKSKSLGQVFISSTNPGYTRGNHWHHTKIEKFLVIEGQGIIKFRHLSNGRTFDIEVSGTQPQVIDIPAGYVHSITNTGDGNMLLLIWSDQLFSQEKPDTYFMEV